MGKNKENIYESFLFVFILIFIGGFVNAYTYKLHGEYLASMNTGNMARMGIAITEHRIKDTGIYLMSICANAFGAMMSFFLRQKISKGLVSKYYQRACLIAEFCIFIIIAFLPLSLPNFIVNFTISFTCGFQLASFTAWEGNVVATTLGSGNVRFLGEHLGNAIMFPSKKTIRTFILFLLITTGFTIGVIVGVYAIELMSKYSIFIPAALVLVLMIIDNCISKKIYQK